MDYDELQQSVGRFNENQKARRRENYHYAREKGFSAQESMILASKSKPEIDKIAEERDNKAVGDAS